MYSLAACRTPGPGSFRRRPFACCSIAGHTTGPAGSVSSGTRQAAVGAIMSTMSEEVAPHVDPQAAHVGQTRP